MSVKKQYSLAKHIITVLSGEDAERLLKICLEIRDAEIRLKDKSRPVMVRCLQKCEGLCCRNVQLDLIINYLDFIYILTLEPAWNEKIEKCLDKETPFFSSDCIFLENEVGPCIFPFSARPEVCLVTFCDDVHLLKKEIAAVKRKFFKLTWFILMRKPRAIKNWFFKAEE